MNKKNKLISTDIYSIPTVFQKLQASNKAVIFLIHFLRLLPISPSGPSSSIFVAHLWASFDFRKSGQFLSVDICIHKSFHSVTELHVGSLSRFATATQFAMVQHCSLLI